MVRSSITFALDTEKKPNQLSKYGITISEDYNLRLNFINLIDFKIANN